MENVNDIYFDGHYKHIWRSMIPDELTVKEVDFMLSYFNLQPGSKVVDLMCGYGRHTLSLAGKGIEVTAVDNLPYYINEIRAKSKDLPVKAVEKEVLDFTTDEEFDLAICMGNSLNFFNAADTTQIFKNVFSYLKKGGSLLINSVALAEITYKTYRKEKIWSEYDGIRHLADYEIQFHPTTLEIKSIMIGPDVKKKKKKAVDYIFSINEMEKMMNEAGLILKEIYSIPGKKKFTVGEPRAYIVAEKN